MISPRNPTADAWDVSLLRGHVGREASATDRVTAGLARQLLDVIGVEGAVEGEMAPLGIQWCLAPPDVPLRGLQEDGHAKPGYTILPPVPAARRMWAGGEIVWHDALRIGDEVTRRSVVADVSVKEGRSGTLCFVTVRHDYATARGAAIGERQDIVYRRLDDGKGSEAAADRPAPAAPAGHALRRVATDAVRLFRYSAMTGNAHRIHYDHPYVTGVEGYPGIVVHGPLQATMLMQAAATLAGRPPSRFAYRAVAPIFCGEDITLFHAGNAPAASLWTGSGAGRVHVRADVAWEPA